jgi:UDP-N-acetylmuramate dehydrogenase
VVTPAEAWRALADTLGSRATRGKPLGPLTTYGVGGPAALYVEVDAPEDLDAVRSALRDTAAALGAPPAVFVLGRGSNVLVADEGFDGIVLHLGAGFAGVDLPGPESESGPGPGSGSGPAEVGGRDGTRVVQAGAAVALPVLARRVADGGWTGLSWAVGVPGSLGGAVRMNAGGHGSDMASCLVRYSWVDLYSEAGATDDVTHLAYGYRASSVAASQLVVAAELAVAPGSAEEERAAVAAIVRWRRAHQPGGSNAGSVFTNPEDDSAGRLIETAGLKGFRIGTAHVSEKHANFIQADRGGRAADVHALMTHVRAVVAERCGVTLRAEVRLLGFGDMNNGPVDGNGDGSGVGHAGVTR